MSGKQYVTVFNEYALYTMCGHCLIKVSDIDYESNFVECRPINIGFINYDQFIPIAEKILQDQSLATTYEVIEEEEESEESIEMAEEEIEEETEEDYYGVQE